MKFIPTNKVDYTIKNQKKYTKINKIIKPLILVAFITIVFVLFHPTVISDTNDSWFNSSWEYRKATRARDMGKVTRGSEGISAGSYHL